MKLTTTFLGLLSQIRIYHWQTKSYAEHQALGSLHDTLNGLVDEFMEVYMGRYGTIVAKEKFEFTCENYSEGSSKELMDKCISYLKEDVTKGLPEDDTDLLNIRDEMIAAMNKTKYLLRLK